MKTFLLVGNPNIGKSVIFSRLTGVKVIASNYPGTTVEYTEGMMYLGKERHRLIDAPGIYSLKPTSKAEEVAVKLIEQADVLINVLDATNLERNLYLTLELIKKVQKPMVVVLNVWDETKHRGIEIDVKKLKEILGVEVIPTCALSGEGIAQLVLALNSPRIPLLQIQFDSMWCAIGEILEKVQKLHHRHHTLIDILQEISIKPPFSFIIAALVIFLSFLTIRFLGENLINYICDPIFAKFYTPIATKLSRILGEGSFLHTILIGKLVDGEIDYSQSFGLLTTGLYVPFAMVLPYLISFYFILGLLEDFGYLPRLAIVCDRFFHRLGLHGFAIIPTVLGLGCNVPGALSMRLLESRKEKFITATLLAIAVPCMAQTAMIIALLGPFGGKYVGLVFLVLAIIWYISGIILNHFVKGASPEMLLEIPPYRIPHFPSVIKKLWIRVYWFLKEAIPLVLIGVGIVNVLYFFGIIDFLGKLFYPVVTKLWGLPKEAIGALLIGFLRKDVAVGMLRPLNLTAHQAVVGCTVLAIYFPCMATFVVLFKELGGKDLTKSILIMLLTVIIVGFLLNAFLTFLSL